MEDGEYAIIIENKIYAIDQYHQLLRYNNYGKQRFPKGFKLIYLTLDGHEASKDSLGDNEIDYHLYLIQRTYPKLVIKVCDVSIRQTSGARDNFPIYYTY